MSDQMPPFSEEAEMATVGALMHEPVQFLELAHQMGLTQEAFYVPGCNAVFGAIMAMGEKHAANLDFSTVTEWMEREKTLEQAGGRRGIEKMFEACVTVSHAEYYLALVKQHSLKRRFIDWARERSHDAYTAELGDELIRACGAELMQMLPLEEERESNGELMAKSVEKWRAVKAGGKPAIGIETPWVKMTNLMCGFEQGITIAAARPGVGKSTFEGQCAVYSASQGLNVLRFSLEMTRQELLERDVCRFAGASLPKLKFGFGKENQLANCANAVPVLEKYGMWIDDHTWDIQQIASKARALHARRGLHLVTIDYVGLIRHAGMGGREYDANARLTDISAKLKHLAQELRVPILLLSQLSRPPRDPKAKRRVMKRPDLSDLRDSGSLEQDATKVIFLYLDEETIEGMEEAKKGSTKSRRPIWFDVAKHRNGETGQIPMWNWAKYFRFEEHGADDFDGVAEIVGHKQGDDSHGFGDIDAEI